MNRSASARPVRPYLVLLIGILAASTASTWIRLAQGQGAPSLVIAAWRMILASLILLPITLSTRRAELRSLTPQERWLALGSGLLLAIHFSAWISSLAFTSVAASVVLVSTNPLFVGLMSHFLLGERLSRWLAAGLVVSTLGAVLIGLGDSRGGGSNALLGDALALIGAVSAAGYMLIGRRLRARLSLLAYVTPVYGAAALALLLLCVLTRQPLWGYAPGTWVLFLMLALLPQIVGHSSLNWALRYLSATYVTLVVLAEPLGSSVLAWLLLDERPTLWALAGGALTLLGIAVASRRDRARA